MTVGRGSGGRRWPVWSAECWKLEGGCPRLAPGMNRGQGSWTTSLIMSDLPSLACSASRGLDAPPLGFGMPATSRVWYVRSGFWGGVGRIFVVGDAASGCFPGCCRLGGLVGGAGFRIIVLPCCRNSVFLELRKEDFIVPPLLLSYAPQPHQKLADDCGV